MATVSVILGAGYTGRRVAALLEAQGKPVLVTHRDTMDVLRPETIAAWAERVPAGCAILHSIPLIQGQMGLVRPTPLLEPILKKAGRVVYLSTTGVYGAAKVVDAGTPTAPRVQREVLRVEEEEDVKRLCPSVLILRPAAIYGPHRGVHISLQRNAHRLWGDGSNYISRIHVDDLAAISAAALRSSVTGEFPVADHHPCPAIEITEFCASLLSIATPAPEGRLPPTDTRSSDRRVDGSAICKLLNIQLRYGSYREGVPAAMSDERPTEGSVYLQSML